MKRILLFFLIVFISFFSYAQETNELLVEILDSKSNEPISFATVILKGTAKGVVADYNGQLRLPKRVQSNDSILVITSIGYKKLEYNTNLLKPKVINKILMDVETTILDEVVISSLKKNQKRIESSDISIKEKLNVSAKSIVRRAVNRIKNNLSDEPHSYIGYYRDYQVVKDKYHNLKEYILENFDSGINSNLFKSGNNQAALYKFKINPTFVQDSSLVKAYDNSKKYIQNVTLLPFGGNEFTILNIHNAIRNYNMPTYSFVYTMEDEFLINHSFEKDVFFYRDEQEPILRVRFNSLWSKVGLRFSASGFLYISLRDFAIYKMEYAAYDNKKDVFNVRVEYRRIQDKMFLNYITFNNDFVVKDDFVFKEVDMVFNQDEQSILISFNNDIDPASIYNKNFRFRLDNTRFKIISSKLIKKNKVEVKIGNWDNSPVSLSGDELAQIKYRIRRIKDITGRVINKPKKISGYQFRELFVQEVFPDKALDTTLSYILKDKPLKASKINTSIKSDQYWTNTPLMERKTN